MSHFTKDLLKSRINAGIKGKIGVLIDADETMNQAVREVLAEADLRSTRRVASIQPGVFDNVYAYAAPGDIKAQKIVSISPQANAGATYYPFSLIPYEQFNARYGFYGRYNNDYANLNLVRINSRELYTVAFDELNGVRTILLSAPQNGNSQTIATLDSLTDDGAWGGYGDVANLRVDPGNYLYGTSSIAFDIAAFAGTTAGIVNSTKTPFSIADYLTSTSAIFCGAYISDVSEITNFKIRIGTDATNYYELTTTLSNVNAALAEGWNILRFDMNGRQETGSVDDDNITYIALYMTKLTTKINQTDFRFDHITLQNGDIFNIRYYSKYGWQTQAGVWLENSVNDDDVLNADMDEFNLFIDKGIDLAGQEVDETTASTTAAARYQKNLNRYLMNSPSEAFIETSDYQAQYYI